jgi:peptide/nickel transport system substrate-binding protein
LVGSGPFVLDGETKFGPKADEIVLRRNEAYWDRGRVAALDAVEFRLVEDDKRAYQMARTGVVDVTWLLPEQFREAQEEKDGNFLKHHRVLRSYLPEFGYLYIGWNMRPGPLADARVRRAMTALAPRQAMIDVIYMGLARPEATVFWPDGRQNDAGLRPAAYDVAAAGAALDEAGWRLDEKAETPRRVKDGVALKVTVLAPKGGGRMNSLSRMFAESAAKAGVEVDIEELRWPEMKERLAAGKFDGALMGWSGALEIDPYLFFHSSQTAAGGLNYIGFQNGEVDRLSEAIRHELNRDARNRLCHELAGVLEREQPYTLLLEPESVVAVGTKFKGVRSYRLGLRPEEWYVGAEE